MRNGLAKATLVAALGLVMTGSTFGYGDDAPRDGDLVTIMSEEIFVPLGFDDNDEVVVVLDGFLPSSCYQLTRPEVNFDQESKTFRVYAMARYFDGVCVQALIPFTQDVPLGTLAMGDYKIATNQGNLNRDLLIDEALNAGPDDYLYAPVEAVWVEKTADGAGLQAVIEGRFMSNCMSWDSAEVLEESGSTLVILPKMTMADREDCAAEQIRFRETVALPDSVMEGRHLLHVRSLNGRAVNLVFEK